jgi:hypothetical protein
VTGSRTAREGGTISIVRRLLLLAAILATAPACLVVAVNPSHTRDSLIWEPALLGDWQNVDDASSMRIERGEWQSYTVEYSHTIEKGRLTGYLTRIGKDQYLDVMPARGEDHGSFLLPVHVVLRTRLDGDRLELTPLSYDWFFDRVQKKAAIAGLTVVLDEKENALIVSSTSALRAWIARQVGTGPAYGPAAVFVRKKAG